MSSFVCLDLTSFERYTGIQGCTSVQRNILVLTFPPSLLPSTACQQDGLYGEQGIKSWDAQC